jgi:protein-disulfide isomerase
VILAACSTSAQPAKQMAPTEVVATVGSSPVTLADVDAIALQESASSFGNARLVQALYLARRAALDEIIATRLIEQEAKARGTQADALVKQEIDGKTRVPTAEDVTFWYQTNPDAVQGRPLEQLSTAIRSLLTEQRLAEAHNSFVETLKLKTPVTVRLDPPRQTVASEGHAAKGPKGAPVEIVEFSDFQCPFCQRVNPTVDQVLKTYGDRIRFVYRHYPLPNHPNARPAAEAAVCADQQGKFWAFHDRLFGSPDKLTGADLKAHAAAAGVDTAKFNACVDGKLTKDAVELDIKEANAVGVSATPTFFVNGRSLEGAQPFDAFKRLIDEELAAAKR